MKIDVWRSLLRYPQSLYALILFGATICSLPIAAQAKDSSLYGLGIVQRRDTVVVRCPTVVSLSILAPDDGARTLSEYPTIYWYINQRLSGNEFFNIRLGKGISNHRVFYKDSNNLDRSASRLYSFTMPLNSKPLAELELYTWDITFNAPYSSNVSSRAFIKRESNPSVEQQVKIASTDLEKARIFAQNRYWYDALHLYSIWILAHPDDTIALSERKAMLDEIVDKPKDKCYGKSELYDSSPINAPQPIQQILP